MTSFLRLAFIATISLLTWIAFAQAADKTSFASDACSTLLETSPLLNQSRVENLSRTQWNQLTEEHQSFLLNVGEKTHNHYEIIQLIQLARTSDDSRWIPLLKKWITDLENITQGWEVLIRVQAQKALKEFDNTAAIEAQLQNQKSQIETQNSKFHELSFEELSSVRSDFKHNNRYSLEITPSPIQDQCNMGSCWIYSLVAEIEHDPFLKKRNEKISEQFLILHSLIEESFLALEQAGSFIKTGGTLTKAHDLVQKYGLVPTSSWKPRLPFEASPLSHRLLTFLNARITQYHLDSAYKWSDQAKQDLKESAKKDILSIIEAYFGPTPQKLIYDGKEFTPIEWRDTQVASYTQKWVIIRPTSTAQLPHSLEQLASKLSPLPQFSTAIHSRFEQKTIETITQIIVHRLQQGQMVPFAIEMDYSFIDRNNGIMSLNAFHLPEAFKPIPKAYRRAFDMDGKYLGIRFHAMDIVGVDLDKTGKIIKYKVRNSHGEGQGDQGYFHIYPDYFEEYLVSIAIADMTENPIGIYPK